ncbi:nuclear transport factor 2 family protein [Ferruginibacter sp. HRS2-29]|uniref:nuclear transport factor 2 family protein n=1 Tax=Ferruginibacter sp. HRS2-29 TaxID=2487334 RepID=UPI0020CC7AA4|nr:nuclear transport factor 2 family protein [Ferruginibacter sp. HRS2-29]MCP9750542.1 nuclear transport factor 2 family protein [Ferruginibacter sp. HRS2-29]
MNTPTVIEHLVAAQNNADSQAYADCFSNNAIVHDEGKTHQGKPAIKSWIEEANARYQTRMKPLEYSAADKTLKAEISGTFDGSPIVLTYHLAFTEGLIQSLSII